MNAQDLTEVKELAENLNQRLQELSRKPERCKQLEEDDIDVEYRYSSDIYRYILEHFQKLHKAIARLDK